MDNVDEFHAHLDECRQCRENPFGLCFIGERLLLRATVMPLMKGQANKASTGRAKRGAKSKSLNGKGGAKAARQ